MDLNFVSKILNIGAGIAQPVEWLRAGRPSFESLYGQRFSSLRHRIQTGSGSHPACYPMDAAGSIRWGLVTVAWHDHLLPSSAEVKKAWSYILSTPYVYMVWCLVKHRDNFTLPRCQGCGSSMWQSSVDAAPTVLAQHARTHTQVTGIGCDGWLQDNLLWPITKEEQAPLASTIRVVYHR